MWSAEAWPYQQSGWFPLKAAAPKCDRRCVVFPDSIFENLWKFGICNISMLLFLQCLWCSLRLLGTVGSGWNWEDIPDIPSLCRFSVMNPRHSCAHLAVIWMIYFYLHIPAPVTFLTLQIEESQLHFSLFKSSWSLPFHKFNIKKVRWNNQHNTFDVDVQIILPSLPII